VPSAAVVAAATVVRAAWAAVGLVNPGMVNVIGLPAPNVPADIVTVKTDPERAAAPAGLPVLGAVNVRVPAPARAKPAPARGFQDSQGFSGIVGTPGSQDFRILRYFIFRYF